VLLKFFYNHGIMTPINTPAAATPLQARVYT